MRRYLHADANLFSHIQTLRIAVGVLAICLVGSILGWHHASRIQRISIPPDLRYGAQVVLNTTHPWEVYNFAGYIWQQLNRCPSDCVKDYPKNLERLTEFLTPEFKSWLKHDSGKRTTELAGRSRFLVPLATTNFRELVRQDDSGNWHVALDVELKEDIDGVAVKSVGIRYHLRIIARPIDPEFNPWGLLLDTMVNKPERIVVDES